LLFGIHLVLLVWHCGFRTTGELLFSVFRLSLLITQLRYVDCCRELRLFTASYFFAAAKKSNQKKPSLFDCPERSVWGA